MSRHAPGKIPKGTKWGVCEVCGYRIRDCDDFENVSDDGMKYAHARCAGEYTAEVDETA